MASALTVALLLIARMETHAERDPCRTYTIF